MSVVLIPFAIFWAVLSMIGGVCEGIRELQEEELEDAE